jgi:quercetin dioxygenase-like cupin family protein
VALSGNSLELNVDGGFTRDWTRYMKLFAFTSSHGQHVDQYGSDFGLTPLWRTSGDSSVVCVHLSPGGSIGEHQAVSNQLLCVVQGDGWVSGEGDRVPIAAGHAVLWREGEAHSAGTDSGMTAFVVEGAFEVMLPSDPASS